VIAEGKTFDDYSLVVDLPAKTLRPLPRAVGHDARRCPKRDVENGRRFETELRRIG
jgi:hypothetical protein